jgi:cytochrome c-type biogenesis protein CcmF
VYAVLGEPADDGRWTVRVYYKTLVAWIWVGGFLMYLGGLVSLADRRLRVGAPAPRRAARAAMQGAGDD